MVGEGFWPQIQSGMCVTRSRSSFGSDFRLLVDELVEEWERDENNLRLRLAGTSLWLGAIKGVRPTHNKVFNGCASPHLVCGWLRHLIRKAYVASHNLNNGVICTNILPNSK